MKQVTNANIIDDQLPWVGLSHTLAGGSDERLGVEETTQPNGAWPQG